MTTLTEIKNSTPKLKAGEEINIETKDKEDLRIATILIRRGMFKIWFNGALIHSCVTMSSLIARLKKLDLDWDLELTWI